MNLKHSLLAMALVGSSATHVALAGPGAAGAGAQRKLLDPKNIDRSVSPGENFYRFANGAWLKSNPIPADQTRWGSFNELQEFNYAALRSLLDGAAASNGAAGSREQMVGDFYRSGMDSATIERVGIEPLNPHLARISGIRDAAGILKEVAIEHSLGLNTLFSFGISPDDKEVTKEICQFYQGGLGMPDRDYYFKTDARSTKIRDAYKKYLVQVGVLMGSSQAAAEKSADDVYAIEEALAKASMTRVELRDPYNVYHKYSLAGINAETPGMDWRNLIRDLKIQGADTIIVGQPVFFAAVGSMLRDKSADAWKAYLKTHMVIDMSPFLSKVFADARFEFSGRTIRGQQAQQPRWKRVLSMVDGNVGELLGQMYVDKNFKPEAKARMLALVNNLQQTYASRIQRLDWMTPETKVRALAKLNSFLKKIGYTDKWKDYKGLRVVSNDYVANIFSASQWGYNYELSKLGRPVDKTEWGMTPPTVNAYYNPAFNEIVFPAGILQYPFFDDKADDAVNYGGIGAVIGHEMTHGFDDQGRQYDVDGNLKNWWTPADSAAFTQRANKVVEQFNNYTVLDTVHVNGELTEGENLADLGGIAIAYEAFQKTAQAKAGKKIDGFTPQQRFFLSWAQVWRGNTRPEEIASRIVTDPHSPNELRCNGPVSNMPEFYQAFSVKPGNKMYRAAGDRAKVW